MQNTNMLLTLIFVVLIGGLGFIIYQNQHETPGEKVAQSVGEFTEEVSDEIDDATTN